jgi:hypothetical protein
MYYRDTMRRVTTSPFVSVLLACALAAAPPVGHAQSPPPAAADQDLLARARALIAEIRAFQRLNDEIITLCHEPVTGSYSDWRDDFHEDLERVRGLEKALRGPAAKAAGDDPALAAALKPFVEAGSQELYSRCLRWGTGLIQHESRVRAEMAAKFVVLKANEAKIRAAAASEAGAKQN